MVVRRRGRRLLEDLPSNANAVPSTWGFRVGFDGQSPDEKEKDLVAKMTAVLGEAVAFSLLVAIKSFIDDGRSGTDLDSRFKAAYKTLKTTFLRQDANTPKPYYSALTEMQALITDGKLKVNVSAFDCELFRRSDKWYLTEKRAVNLSEEDGELFEKLKVFAYTR